MYVNVQVCASILGVGEHPKVTIKCVTCRCTCKCTCTSTCTCTCNCITVNREYFVSKIFRIFIFRMYKFSCVRMLLFTNTVYFHIPVNFRIFKFRTHTVIRKFL